jgi:hypothetical protein
MVHSFIDILRRALDEEMARDASVHLLGEDIAAGVLSALRAACRTNTAPRECATTDPKTTAEHPARHSSRHPKFSVHLPSRMI